jgi:asparagine synthase (glutamine-hydrolysing)
VQTFTLGHTDLSFDESRFAKKTAQHFGAEFNELILTEVDLESGLQLVGQGFDEPLGDASIIPTLLLSHFAREKVKVVLSGEGADEMFAGYPTYLGNKIVGTYQKIPAVLRRGLLKAVRAFTPVSMGNVGMDYMLQLFADGADRELIERHHTWFGSIHPNLHSGLLSERVCGELQEDDPFAAARAIRGDKKFPDSLAEVLHQDFSLYLQDDLLTKVDRSTMLASLEARAPFLDHNLVEYVARIPSSLKIKRLTTKAILRKAVQHRLPKEVLNQRKRGFNIPFSRWLLHGLGEKMASRFSRERVEARGLFNPDGISQLLDEHMNRKADHRKPLFALLAFDMWCDSTYGEGVEIPISTNLANDNEIRQNRSDRGCGSVSVVPGSA